MKLLRKLKTTSAASILGLSALIGDVMEAKLKNLH